VPTYDFEEVSLIYCLRGRRFGELGKIEYDMRGWHEPGGMSGKIGERQLNLKL